MNLSNKQKQYLKGLAHSLKPVIQLGNNGLTEGVLAETEIALSHHELIKVKVPTDDREEKQLIMDAIVRETKSVKVQTVGHILVIYRQSEDKVISIPK
jgi:RNA-binding protein